ncbi:MAG: VanZ family protein [Pseudomonadales bacterium]
MRAFFQCTFWLPLAGCTWLALIPDPPDNPVFRLGDVVLHAAAFTYLTVALVMARLGARPTPEFPTTAALMIGYGLLLEAIQFFIPERSAELKDLLVDAAGIGVGLALARWLALPVYERVLRVSGRL